MSVALFELGLGAWVAYQPAFITDHAEVMRALVRKLPLRQESLFLYGRDIHMPRLTSWHGDAPYTYSGRKFDPAPWCEELLSIRSQLNQLEGVVFNSMLANYYRTGKDSIGEHSDNEPELGPSRDDVRVASVSLGGSRRFVLRNKRTRESRTFELGEGSLLVMGGTTQTYFTHSVPKTARPVGPRLNLTFRVINT